MGDLLSLIFAQIDRMVPERYRVRIVSCTALLGLIGYIYYGHDHYATGADVAAVKAQAVQQITEAVKPLADQMRSDEDSSKRFESIQQHRYMDDLRAQILQDAARCSEARDKDARGLYRQALGDLLQRYETAAGNPYPQNVEC